MAKHVYGMLNAKDRKYAIIVSRFNEMITKKLLEGALDCLNRHEAEDSNICVFWVPGSFEIPLVAQKVAELDKYDAIICLGAIIRGDTPHFNFIASETIKGIASVSLKTKKPVIYGVLTCETLEQALERAGTKAGNKGWEAALSAIEVSDLLEKIK